MSSQQRKRARRRQRPVVSSYPVPSPEAVNDMKRELFSGHFADEHLSAVLGRASAAISAEFHEDVRRYRVPIHHWRIMAALSDSDGMSLAELAEVTLLTQPTVTRLVQRLEEQGMLRKSANNQDRRMLRVALTARGRKKVDELIIMANERQKRILHGLDAEALKNALHHLIAFCAAKRRRKRRSSVKSL